jgi:hypothetical protein
LTNQLSHHQKKHLHRPNRKQNQPKQNTCSHQPNLGLYMAEKRCCSRAASGSCAAMSLVGRAEKSTVEARKSLSSSLPHLSLALSFHSCSRCSGRSQRGAAACGVARRVRKITRGLRVEEEARLDSTPLKEAARASPPEGRRLATGRVVGGWREESRGTTRCGKKNIESFFSLRRGTVGSPGLGA